MARIRRVIRRLKPARDLDLFDDHSWPVCIALIALGGFLIGMVLAHLRFDAPAWYLRPWFWIGTIATTIVTLMIAAGLVGSRFLRRSLQLAAVISLALHVVLVFVLLWVRFPAPTPLVIRTGDPDHRRQPRVIHEYVRRTNTDRENLRDFERPVPADTPDPQPDPLEPETTEERRSPVQYQPTPVSEPEVTARPRVVPRRTPSDVAPRLSQRPSRLSRRSSDASVSTRSALDTPDPVVGSAGQPVEASDSSIARRDTRSAVARSDDSATPTTTTRTAPLELSRRQSESPVAPESTAVPSVRRQADTPRRTPTTRVAVDDAPAATRRTSESPVRPSLTSADKVETAAPRVDSSRPEPAPEQTVDRSPQVNRSQLPTEQRPGLARTPAPVPNRRARVTTRPDVTSSATTVAARPLPAAAAENVAARPTTVGRDGATTDRAAATRPNVSAPEPPTVDPAESIARRQPLAESQSEIVRNDRSTPDRRTSPSSRPNVEEIAANVSNRPDATVPDRPSPVSERTSPVRQANTDNQASRVRRSIVTNEPGSTEGLGPSSIRRRDVSAGAEPPSPERSVEETREPSAATAAAIARTEPERALPTRSRSVEATARATPIDRQGSENATLARSDPSPVSSDVPDRSTTASQGTAPSRRPMMEESPRVASAPHPAQPRRDVADARPDTATITGPADRSAALDQSDDPRPRPSDASVARQARPAESAVSDRPSSADVPSLAATTQFSRPATRSDDTGLPSLTPDRPAESLPRRAQVAARVPTSPGPVESPAPASDQQVHGDPAAQPARSALDRALAGVAGIGMARNLEHSPPTTDRPNTSDQSASVRSALQATASARRAEATHPDPPGPALSPSTVSQVRRTRAMADLPSSTLQAQLLENAPDGGIDRPSDVNASSGAALTRADAAARRDDVAAPRGTIEVDLGPTRLVSDAPTARQDPSNLNGGGGQPVINLETQTQQFARSEVGGSPASSIAAAERAETVAAPAADGSRAAPTPANLDATSLARADEGADQPVSGGPSNAETGPTREANSAERIATASLDRAIAVRRAEGPEIDGGGEPDEEDEEERLNRLRRDASGGAPRVAISALAVADQLASPTTDSAGEPGNRPPEASLETVRIPGGGEPLVGGPSATARVGPPEDPGLGSRDAQSAISRSERAEAVIGNPTDGGGQADDADTIPLQVARRDPGAAPTTGESDDAIQLPSIPTPLTASSMPAPSPNGRTAEVARVTDDRTAPSARDSSPAARPAEQGGELVASLEIRRAEAVDGGRGQPLAGGGTRSPARDASGPELVSDNRAALPAAAGSAGTPRAELTASASSELARGGAVESPAVTERAGARIDDTVIAADRPEELGPGAAGRRNRGASDEDGPLLTQRSNEGAPLSRGAVVALPGTIDDVAAPDVSSSPGDASGGASSGELARTMEDVGPMTRDSTDAADVPLPTLDGPGGLGERYSVDVGINHRRARSDSVRIHAQDVRFVRQEIAGRPSSSSAAVIATEPFRRNARRGQDAGDGRGSVGPKTEEAIERGLAFLARYQSPDGSWSLQAVDNQATLISDTAATGLALMAFQGAGYTHKEHKYADVVQRGIRFLVDHQVRSDDPLTDGDLFLDQLGGESGDQLAARLYSHAIATLALCEAYGMTQDPNLRPPAQAAVEFIQNTQHSERGGWRYVPGQESDTSVTGWMMMALKSGQLANLDVRRDTFVRINAWLDRSQASDDQRHLYRYNPYAPDTDETRHGRLPSKTMTSVGLLMRLYNGWDKDDEFMGRGAEYLAENLPALGTERRPLRDTYYWYYATQVMFHMGGEQWRRWNEELHPLLVSGQIDRGPLAGSWDPLAPVPDRWAAHGGRIYVTTMNLLSLEVHYRHLPLYDEYGEPEQVKVSRAGR